MPEVSKATFLPDGHSLSLDPRIDLTFTETLNAFPIGTKAPGFRGPVQGARCQGCHRPGRKMSGADATPSEKNMPRCTVVFSMTPSL